ncbi:MAG TPA: diguanylate cyclase [Candidatus Thermoplasmatota archaeon]
MRGVDSGEWEDSPRPAADGYLAPIALGTWRIGRGMGLLLSFASAAAWLAADLVLHPAHNRSASRSLNLVQDLGVFVAFALLLAGLRQRFLEQETLARTDPRTRQGVRAVDVVARLGGDEFALLLPDTSGPTRRCSSRDCALACARPPRTPGLTFSVGAVTFRDAPGSVDEMIRTGDEVMYSVKQSGKNGLRHAEVPGAPATQPAG